MSIIDQKRLPPDIFNIDVERMCRGWYSDHYFNNVTAILSTLAAEKYHFQGHCPALTAQGIDTAGPDTVVMTDVNPLARWSWELLDEARWTLVASDDLAEAGAALDAAGIETFVYVGHRAGDEIEALSRRHQVAAQLSPSFDDGWQVVVFE